MFDDEAPRYRRASRYCATAARRPFIGCPVGRTSQSPSQKSSTRKLGNGVIGAMCLGEQLPQPVCGRRGRDAKPLVLAKDPFRLGVLAVLEKSHAAAKARYWMSGELRRERGVRIEGTLPIGLDEERVRALQLNQRETPFHTRTATHVVAASGKRDAGGWRTCSDCVCGGR